MSDLFGDGPNGNHDGSWAPVIGALICGAVFGPGGSGVGYLLGKLWSSSQGND